MGHDDEHVGQMIPQRSQAKHTGAFHSITTAGRWDGRYSVSPLTSFQELIHGLGQMTRSFREASRTPIPGGHLTPTSMSTWVGWWRNDEAAQRGRRNPWAKQLMQSCSLPFDSGCLKRSCVKAVRVSRMRASICERSMRLMLDHPWSCVVSLPSSPGGPLLGVASRARERALLMTPGGGTRRL